MPEMPKFDPLTSVRIDEDTGQVTSGASAREQRVAEAGGVDKLQAKAYQQGFLNGHAEGYQEGFQEGFQEGLEVGAAEAYRRVDARLARIERALSPHPGE